MKNIRFISSNQFKIEEAEKILGEVGVEIIPISLKIDEIQSDDTHKLICDKALKAFENPKFPKLIIKKQKP